MKKILSLILLALTLCGAVQASPSGKEQTLSIIKPDAVGANRIGEVVALLERGGLQVVAMKMMHLTQQQAEAFYAVHKERSFYPELVEYMISGPVVVMALEGPDAVLANRQIMGATNPEEAQPGTIRAQFGRNIQENAVHGSDSVENGRKEVNFFFHENELLKRTR